MVDDDIAGVASPKAVAVVAARIPMPHPHVPDNNVMRANENPLVGKANPFARGSLAGDREKRGLDTQTVFEVNRPGNGKHDNAWFFCFNGLPQAAGDSAGFMSIIVQCLYDVNLASAATRGVGAKTFRARKC